jgi:hypothetical protein
MIRFLGIGLIALVGCYSPSVPNGDLKCSSGGKCPEGFHCATDGKCWKNGQDPTPGDMATMSGVDAGPDMAKPRDMAMMPDAALAPSVPHKGTSVMSGAVKATSQHYTIIMSTGQAPGGNGTATSPTKQLSSGVVGATQKK